MAHHFTKASPSSSWLLLVLGTFAVLSNANIHPVKAQRFCGKKLTDTLSAYCEVYPTLPPVMKRFHGGGYSVEGTNYRDALLSNVPPNVVGEQRAMVGLINSKPNWLRAIFSTKNHIPAEMGDDFTGLMVPNRFQQRKRGVVDDCCHESCSLHYLLSNYCG